MSQGQFYILQLTSLITDILWEEAIYRSRVLQKKQLAQKNPQNSAFWLIFVPWVCDQTEVKQGPEPKARSVQAPSVAYWYLPQFYFLP